MTFNYIPSHQSADDASPAMLVALDAVAGTITLVNEDGFVWTDPDSEWEPIEISDEPLVDAYAFMNVDGFSDIYGDGIYDSEEAYLNR